MMALAAGYLTSRAVDRFVHGDEIVGWVLMVVSMIAVGGSTAITAYRAGFVAGMRKFCWLTENIERVRADLDPCPPSESGSSSTTEPNTAP